MGCLQFILKIDCRESSQASVNKTQNQIYKKITNRIIGILEKFGEKKTDMPGEKGTAPKTKSKEKQPKAWYSNQVILRQG